MNTRATVTSLRSVGPPIHSASAEVANINGWPRVHEVAHRPFAQEHLPAAE